MEMLRMYKYRFLKARYMYIKLYFGILEVIKKKE